MLRSMVLQYATFLPLYIALYFRPCCVLNASTLQRVRRHQAHKILPVSESNRCWQPEGATGLQPRVVSRSQTLSASESLVRTCSGHPPGCGCWPQCYVATFLARFLARHARLVSFTCVEFHIWLLQTKCCFLLHITICTLQKRNGYFKPC